MSQTQKTPVSKVNVFVNRRKIELRDDEMTAAQFLETAGFEGNRWELFRLRGEHDPSGGDPIPAGEILRLKNGDRFRVIPGDRTFGS